MLSCPFLTHSYSLNVLLVIELRCDFPFDRCVLCSCCVIHAVLQVVLLCDCSHSVALYVDNACRQLGVAFVNAQVCGVFASLFVDLAPKFVVLDRTG
jgi:hypothetical protein